LESQREAPLRSYVDNRRGTSGIPHEIRTFAQASSCHRLASPETEAALGFSGRLPP
jgi:hypothetical protein